MAGNARNEVGNAGEGGERAFASRGSREFADICKRFVRFYGHAGKKKFLTSHRRIPGDQRRETRKIVKKPGRARGEGTRVSRKR